MDNKKNKQKQGINILISFSDKLSHTPQTVDKAPVATVCSASVPGGAQWTKKHGVVHRLLKEPAGAHWKAHRGNVIKEAHTG